MLPDRADPNEPRGVKQPTILRLDELMSRDFPPTRWAVPGILPEGLSLLAGKPKLGKSFLALNLGITIAAGGKALGSVAVDSGDVLYLALEDRYRRLQDRARKILDGLGCIASARLHLACEWPRMTQDGLGFIEDWIEKQSGAKLVVIDVWARFRPPPS
jgi:RecA-family ATPase